MKKLILVVLFAQFLLVQSFAQIQQRPAGTIRTAKKPVTSTSKTPAYTPTINPASKNIVYQYIDTLFPNS